MHLDAKMQGHGKQHGKKLFTPLISSFHPDCGQKRKSTTHRMKPTRRYSLLRSASVDRSGWLTKSSISLVGNRIKSNAQLEYVDIPTRHSCHLRHQPEMISMPFADPLFKVAEFAWMP
jgi:hypothetical protein